MLFPRSRRRALTLLIAEQDVRWPHGLTGHVAELEMGRIVGSREI
jgi:hypothetical protein